MYIQSALGIYHILARSGSHLLSGHDRNGYFLISIVNLYELLVMDEYVVFWLTLFSTSSLVGRSLEVEQAESSLPAEKERFTILLCLIFQNRFCSPFRKTRVEVFLVQLKSVLFELLMPLNPNCFFGLGETRGSLSRNHILFLLHSLCVLSFCLPYFAYA